MATVIPARSSICCGYGCPCQQTVLPGCFMQRYGAVEIGKRGGIATKETHLHAPLNKRIALAALLARRL